MYFAFCVEYLLGKQSKFLVLILRSDHAKLLIWWKLNLTSDQSIYAFKVFRLTFLKKNGQKGETIFNRNQMKTFESVNTLIKATTQVLYCNQCLNAILVMWS